MNIPTHVISTLTRIPILVFHVLGLHCCTQGNHFRNTVYTRSNITHVLTSQKGEIKETGTKAQLNITHVLTSQKGEIKETGTKAQSNITHVLTSQKGEIKETGTKAQLNIHMCFKSYV